MPRDLPLGNGSLLVNFDRSYNIRDIFYPHVGSENHVCGYYCRLGVWADGAFAWVADDGWQRELRYEDDTLVTNVRLTHPRLNVSIHVTDAVDFARPLLVRRFAIAPGGAADVRLFLGLDLRIYGNPIGDTALYKPDAKALIHYKESRYFLHGGIGRNGALDDWACGQKDFNFQEGTWRDAEDGELSRNPIAQGSVDSVIALHASDAAREERILYAWLALGKDMNAVEHLNERLRDGPEIFLERTRSYWSLWSNRDRMDFGPMPDALVSQYTRSLLTIRTQIDDGGGILAANDSDNQAYNGDTYSYVWPRDGALVSFALDEAGRHELASAFYRFCGRIVHEGGYFQHKYNPDGTLASSWHPYEVDGRPRLPIQEDETALVVWSLWHHFDRTRSIESIRELYGPLVVEAGTFLSEYVDGNGLCKASYDLWEERWGVHAFTVGAVFGGLQAAANFAQAFGEEGDAKRFSAAAARLQEEVVERFFDAQAGRFARMIGVDDDGRFAPDWTPDAAVFGLFAFGLLDVNDERFTAAADSLFDSLWVETDVGGCARYAGDSYYRIPDAGANVPGNPWFICTLWRARYAIARARTADDLKKTLPLLQWVVDHALPSGILSEQIDPRTGGPISVSPLTWSHAEYVTAFLAYLDKLSTLDICPACHRPLYMREHRRLAEQHLSAAALGSGATAKPPRAKRRHP